MIYFKDGTKYVQMKSQTFNEQIKSGPITKSSAHKLLTTYNTSAEIKDILDRIYSLTQRDKIIK